MADNAFFSADAVVVSKEVTRPKAVGMLPWTIVHFVVADPKTGAPSIEKQMEQGAQAELLKKLVIGDCVSLSMEMVSQGLGRTFPRINGFTPLKKKAYLSFE